MDRKAGQVASKEKVRRGFEEAYPSDLSISEVAARVGLSANTASTYIKVLVAEGILEESRPIGNARLFRLRLSANRAGGSSDGDSRSQGRSDLHSERPIRRRRAIDER